VVIENVSTTNPTGENMKTATANRILAAIMSVTVTLAILDAVALYGHPVPATSQAQSLIAGDSTTVVDLAAAYASFTDSL